MKILQELSPYSELQWTATVEGQNDRFSAASKDNKRYQTMKTGLI